MQVREFFRRLFGIGNDLPARRFEMKPGDRVINTDADAPDAIPAMQVMFGTVVGPDHNHPGWIRVHWDCNKAFGNAPSRVHHAWIRLVTPEEEARRLAAVRQPHRTETSDDHLR